MSIASRKNSAYNENPWSELSGSSHDSSRSSSTQSWVDDSEQTFTKELKEQYEKFEEALYEERSPSDLPKALQAEVKIWSEHSPHIRVRGIKANLYERPDGMIEEEYDSNYEEIIESHGTLEDSLEKGLSFSEDVQQVIEGCPSDEQEIIKTDLKNAIVDKLLDHALPKVLEKFEPVIKSVSAGKRKCVMSAINKSEVYINKLKKQQNERLTFKSNIGRNFIKDIAKRKPLPIDDSTEYQSALSSRGLRHREFDRILEQPSNAKDDSELLAVPKAKVNRSSSLLNQRSSGKTVTNRLKAQSEKKVKQTEEEKANWLPVIEAMPITPKSTFVDSPDKRSVSAMVRFTKTLPRVGPNTARNRNGVQMLPESSDFIEEKNACRSDKFQKNKQKSSYDLQVVGTRSATSFKTNKWRY